jgi:SAM-dependent methyltransferase
MSAMPVRLPLHAPYFAGASNTTSMRIDRYRSSSSSSRRNCRLETSTWLLLLLAASCQVQWTSAWNKQVVPRHSPARAESAGTAVDLSRRQAVTSPFLALATAATLPCLPSWSAVGADADDSLILQQCQNGVLVAEQAVPGAYQQVCMSLPIRNVPVAVPVSRLHQSRSPSLSSSGTVQLLLEQGGAAAGTTGLAVWNSSLLLCRLLQALAVADDTSTAVDKGEFLSSQSSVWELGCGTGLVSLTSAALGAGNVQATDGNPAVVELAQRNLEANRSRIPNANCQLQAMLLPWGLLDASDYTDSADIILGSDLTYNAGSWRVLAETMATLLKPTGCVIYLSLGHAGFEVNAEMDGFLAVARSQGLVPVQSPMDPNWPLPAISYRSLEELLLQKCVSPAERDLLQSTGGVRVLVLCKQKMRSKR